MDLDRAPNELKSYLSSPPLLVTPVGQEDLYLYVLVSTRAVSSVLVRQEGSEHQPIYYSSKTLLPAKMRNLPLEKLALALITAK